MADVVLMILIIGYTLLVIYRAVKNIRRFRCCGSGCAYCSLREKCIRKNINRQP